MEMVKPADWVVPALLDWRENPQLPEPVLKEIPTKMKLKSLQTDAKDLYLCKNGEILFRMDE